MSYKFIGHGVYSLGEAAKLSGVPTRRIRRWMQGYYYTYKDDRRYTPPAIASDIANGELTGFVRFADLLEVRFLDAFRSYGVSWKAIRIAADRARDLLGRHHPFSSRIFRTDGRTIIAELVGETGDKHLLDLVRDQWEFDQVVAPYLYQGVEYNHLDEPERWRPLGHDRHVVIDPEISFGAPTIAGRGIPVRIVANAVRAEESVEFVARLFDLLPAAVADAVEYDARLNA